MTPPRWWPPAGLLLLLALAYGPTLATGGLLAIGDGLGYYLPARAIAAASVQHGELPFWNPYNFAGMPLLAAFQGGVFFPANWAFPVLPPGAAMDLAVLLGYAVAGLATYAYVRALGLMRMPAFLAGACFMGGGYMVAHLEHLTRGTGGGILLTESTRRGLGDGITVEPRRELRLGEPEQAIPVYRLVGISAARAPEVFS